MGFSQVASQRQVVYFPRQRHICVSIPFYHFHLIRHYPMTIIYLLFVSGEKYRTALQPPVRGGCGCHLRPRRRSHQWTKGVNWSNEETVERHIIAM